jgi:hypothetical protein
VTKDTPEFELFPRVVPEGWSGTLLLRGEYDHTRFSQSVSYRYELTSLFWYASSHRRKASIRGEAVPDEEGTLRIPFSPDVTGEWRIVVDAEASGHRHLPCRLGLYVISGDRFHLRPFIGELHCHSTGSDGRQEPAYVPVRARSFGLDFLALTDHQNFQSGREMIDGAMGVLGRRMLLMMGEELHPERREGEDPGQHPHFYHYVAVGHRESVRDSYLADEATTSDEVTQIDKEIGARGAVPGLDLHDYAEGLWKVRKARELGALVLFCHPYWAWPLNIDLSAIEQTFQDGEFDAVEVLSRADPSSLMPNRWARETVAGRSLNVVGVTDHHFWGPDSSLSHSTYVLAEELTQEAIFEAIRGGRSLAFQNGDSPRFVGPDDLVGFAEFYVAKLLPLKRRIMSLEAALGFSALRGGPFNRDLVESLDRELDRLIGRMWASDR